MGEEQVRRQEAKDKDAFQAKRKAQEKIRFDQKLAVKQKMIDLATKQLNALSNQSDQREENQATELKEAEDREMEVRRARRARQQNAIDRSRSLQQKLKSDHILRDKEAAQQLASHYKNRFYRVG